LPRGIDYLPAIELGPRFPELNHLTVPAEALLGIGKELRWYTDAAWFQEELSDEGAKVDAAFPTYKDPVVSLDTESDVEDDDFHSSAESEAKTPPTNDKFVPTKYSDGEGEEEEGEEEEDELGPVPQDLLRILPQGLSTLTITQVYPSRVLLEFLGQIYDSLGDFDRLERIELRLAKDAAEPGPWGLPIFLRELQNIFEVSSMPCVVVGRKKEIVLR
jgi:hypothetical protein